MQNDLQIAELFNTNTPMTEIAMITGLSIATISRRCKCMGLIRQPIWQKVSDNDIIELTKQGLSTITIGTKFGVSMQSIHERQIKLGINRPLTSLINIIADQNRKYVVDSDHFTNLTKIGSYWLGFIFADGCVRNHGSRCKVASEFSFVLKKSDKHAIDQLATDLRLSTDLVEISHKNRAARLVIHDRRFAEVLWNLGLLPGSEYKLHIPSNIYPSQFALGLLDGDGGPYILPGRKLRSGRRGSPFLSITFNIKDEPFGCEFRDFVEKHSSIRLCGPYPIKSIFMLMCSHRKAEDLAHWLWADTTRALARKLAIYNKWFNHPLDLE